MTGLLPGDVLLFARTGLFNRLIQLKTWSAVSHVEVVAIPGAPFFRAPQRWTFNTVASRNGVGVGLYAPDLSQLHSVYRPTVPFDQATALDWFWRDANRQGYDWLGLLAFFNAKRQGRENSKMFCSEFAARYLRIGGVDAFNGYDADGIAPSEFCKSVLLQKLQVIDGRVVAPGTAAAV